MPVSDILPNLDQVYAKWENRGPRQPISTVGNKLQQDTITRQMVENGKQRWKQKFGTNVQPVRHKWARDKSSAVSMPAEMIGSTTIAQFKSLPTIVSEQFSVHRPFMGHCCTCMPNSKKDLITNTTTAEGLRNILDVRYELRGSSTVSRQFSTLVYSWRTRTNHKYPEVSMSVLTSPRVIAAIHAELLSEAVKMDQSALEERAKQILTVMKSKISNTLTKFTGWFLHHFLSLILGGIHVHKGQINMVQMASKRGIPLLFLPLHRSHLDYILITFIMWNYNLKSLNIAAGDNLNIQLFGFLLRSLGAFFIRRKLDKAGARKDAIYRTVLHSYMEQLLKQGEFMEIFLEGGRSRTGKEMVPKGGLLSVVVDSLNTGVIEDVYIIPVSISYEKIVDGNFNDEQMGYEKKKETFFGALKAIWTTLRTFYGSVRVDFAQPFSLKECLQSCKSKSASPVESPSELSPPGSPVIIHLGNSTTSLYGSDFVEESQRQVVQRLGEHVIHTCIHTMALMCTNMLAFLLLTKHRQGTSLKTLIKDFSWLREEVVVRKRDLGLPPSCSTQDVLSYAFTLLSPDCVTISKGQNSLEDKVIPNVDIPSVFELSYYSNQVISVFLMESIIVNSVIYLSDINMSILTSSIQDEVILMSREEIIEVAVKLCSLLKHEFIFVPPCVNLEDTLADTLEQLINHEIVQLEDNQPDGYDNTTERQWAARVSNSLSWVSDEEDGDDMKRVKHFLKVNIAHDDYCEKIKFFHSILAPFFEAYLLTAHHIEEMTSVDMPENDFIRNIHNHGKKRVKDGVASYGESCSMETIKNAVKAYKDLRIIDRYSAGNIVMLELKDRYDVKDVLHYYLQMLEILRG